MFIHRPVQGFKRTLFDCCNIRSVCLVACGPRFVPRKLEDILSEVHQLL
jgi:hypothetical protein